MSTFTSAGSETVLKGLCSVTGEVATPPRSCHSPWGTDCPCLPLPVSPLSFPWPRNPCQTPRDISLCPVSHPSDSPAGLFPGPAHPCAPSRGPRPAVGLWAAWPLLVPREVPSGWGWGCPLPSPPQESPATTSHPSGSHGPTCTLPVPRCSLDRVTEELCPARSPPPRARIWEQLQTELRELDPAACSSIKGFLLCESVYSSGYERPFPRYTLSN